MFLWAVSSPSLWFAHYSINHSLDYWSVMCKQYELRLSNISKTPHCIPQPGLFVTLFVNSFSLSLLWGSMLTLLTVAGYSISSSPWQCPLVMTSAILAQREGLGSPWSSEGEGWKSGSGEHSDLGERLKMQTVNKTEPQSRGLTTCWSLRCRAKVRRGNNNQKDAKEEDSPGSREPWEADKGDVNGRDTVLSVISCPAWLYS